MSTRTTCSLIDDSYRNHTLPLRSTLWHMSTYAHMTSRWKRENLHNQQQIGIRLCNCKFPLIVSPSFCCCLKQATPMSPILWSGAKCWSILCCGNSTLKEFIIYNHKTSHESTFHGNCLLLMKVFSFHKFFKRVVFFFRKYDDKHTHLLPGSFTLHGDMSCGVSNLKPRNSLRTWMRYELFSRAARVFSNTWILLHCNFFLFKLRESFWANRGICVCSMIFFSGSLINRKLIFSSYFTRIETAKATLNDVMSVPDQKMKIDLVLYLLSYTKSLRELFKLSALKKSHQILLLHSEKTLSS